MGRTAARQRKCSLDIEAAGAESIRQHSGRWREPVDVVRQVLRQPSAARLASMLAFRRGPQAAFG